MVIVVDLRNLGHREGCHDSLETDVVLCTSALFKIVKGDYFTNAVLSSSIYPLIEVSIIL